MLNKDGTNLNDNGTPLNWEEELKPFGVLREGISQLRLRKGTDPGDKENDIIGRLNLNSSNVNSLYVDIDETTLPANTLVAVNAIVPNKMRQWTYCTCSSYR